MLNGGERRVALGSLSPSPRFAERVVRGGGVTAMLAESSPPAMPPKPTGVKARVTSHAVTYVRQRLLSMD